MSEQNHTKKPQITSKGNISRHGTICPSHQLISVGWEHAHWVSVSRNASGTSGSVLLGTETITAIAIVVM